MKKKIDILYLINTQTGEEEEYKYRDLRLNKQLKKELRVRTMENNELRFYCGCNIKEPIEMKISNGERMIYTAKNSMVAKHSQYCIKGNNNSEYNPGFKEKEDGDGYIVKTKFKLAPPIKPNSCAKKDDEIEEGISISKQRLSDFNVIDGKLTFSALVKNLNVQTWNNHAKNKNKIVDIYDFNRKIYGMSSKMNLVSGRNENSGVSIQSIFFDSTKDYNLNSKEVRFVYMFLDRYEKINNCYKVYGKDINKYGKSKTVFFNAPTELIEGVLEKSKINQELLKNHNIIMSGLVYKNRAGFLEFYELTFMLVNDYGLYSESKNEVEYYNLLYNCDIYFYKPRWYIEGYGEHISDAELVDLYNGKTVLIEVFGYKTDEYMKEREDKIKFIETELRDSHVLLQWNPCFNEPIHTKEYLENFLNNIR